MADEAAIEVPEAADPPQATNATAATAPGTGKSQNYFTIFQPALALAQDVACVSTNLDIYHD